jgi:hypothetical protein
MLFPIVSATLPPGLGFYGLLLLFPGLPLTVLILFIKFRLAGRDSKKRQPFESQPRPPGWSLQQRVEDMTLDGMFYVFGIALFGLLGTGLYTSTGNLFLFLLVGGGGGIFCLVRGTRLMERVWNGRLGLKGELLVGARLEELRSRDCLVFHDLEFSGKDNTKWNIDHVLLAPSGVFVVETKTRRKLRETAKDQQKGHAVVFDGKSLHFPFGSDRFGLEQALNNAAHIRALLNAQNTTSIPVTPVLVLPGWWVERKGKGDVTVVNEGELGKMALDKPVNLPPDLMRAIGNQLAALCKTS